MNHKFLLILLVYISGLFHCVSTVLAKGSAEDQICNHHVSIHKIKSDDYMYFCSGTIIHKKYVLTAANCFVTSQRGNVTSYMDLVRERPKVIAGINTVDGPGIVLYIAKVFIPKMFQSVPVKHADVAVAELTDDFKLGHMVGTRGLGQIDVDMEVNEEAGYCAFAYKKSIEMEKAKSSSQEILFLIVALLGRSSCPDFKSRICCYHIIDKMKGRALFVESGAGLIFGGYVIGVLSDIPEDYNVVMNFTRVSEFKSLIDDVMNKNSSHNDMLILEMGPGEPKKSPIHR